MHSIMIGNYRVGLDDRWLKLTKTELQIYRLVVLSYETFGIGLEIDEEILSDTFEVSIEEVKKSLKTLCEKELIRATYIIGIDICADDISKELGIPKERVLSSSYIKKLANEPVTYYLEPKKYKDGRLNSKPEDIVKQNITYIENNLH